MFAFLERALKVIGPPLEVNDEYREVDAIVVLGAPCLPDGELSKVQKERVDLGLELYQQGISTLVIISGGSDRHKQTEAAVMGNYALSQGLPSNSLLLEEKSTTTRENAKFTAALMKSKNLTSAWLASQPFHLKRSVSNFKEYGIEAYASVNTKSMQYTQKRSALRWLGREYVAWLAEALKIKS